MHVSVHTEIKWKRERLIKLVMVHWIVSTFTWITVVILELIHAYRAPTGDGRSAFIRSKPIGVGTPAVSPSRKIPKRITGSWWPSVAFRSIDHPRYWINSTVQLTVLDWNDVDRQNIPLIFVDQEININSRKYRNDQVKTLELISLQRAPMDLPSGLRTRSQGQSCATIV